MYIVHFSTNNAKNNQKREMLHSVNLSPPLQWKHHLAKLSDHVYLEQKMTISQKCIWKSSILKAKII